MKRARSTPDHFEHTRSPVQCASTDSVKPTSTGQLLAMRTPMFAIMLLNMLLVMFSITLSTTGSSAALHAQDGFQKLEGKHIQLITDLPVDESIRELVDVFDAAMPEWCRVFGVKPSETQDWRATACVMLERNRFKTAGLLPNTLPEFPHGFQWNDDLWVVEQPTQYYRRHLLLHEGTHWFMFRKFGSAGPPWLMEGTAEWLATHRWRDGRLELGIVPKSPDDVPMWGRITRIKEQLNEGVAPSLDSILRYDTTAHQSTDAYAWSWAAVMFLHNHPATKKAFAGLLDGQLKNDTTPTRQLQRALLPRRTLVRAEWSAMLTGLDYGFVPERELVALDFAARPLDKLAASASFVVRADRGWQAAGISVTAGQKFSVQAQGKYVVGKEPKPWLCEPDGVTIRYVDGQPLGKLMMAIAEPLASEPEFSQRLKIIPIGSASEITAANAGQLLFRVNETGAGLDDNSGEMSVSVARK